MTVQEIKEKLMKKATIFNTGGIRPKNELSESWIGKVSWKKENESIPKDIEGNNMRPLAMLFFEGLSGVPENLNGIYLCTIFISPNVFDHLINLDGYFCVRTYKRNDTLISCNWVNEDVKPFPLVPEEVFNDFPAWDGGIPLEIEKEILRLETEEGIEYFEDIQENFYPIHKVGGYPSYIQARCWDEENYEFDEEKYEFAFQISSDEKACLNIVDSGNFYFFYCKDNNQWKMQCDFF